MNPVLPDQKQIDAMLVEASCRLTSVPQDFRQVVDALNPKATDVNGCNSDVLGDSIQGSPTKCSATCDGIVKQFSGNTDSEKIEKKSPLDARRRRVNVKERSDTENIYSEKTTTESESTQVRVDNAIQSRRSHSKQEFNIEHDFGCIDKVRMKSQRNQKVGDMIQGKEGSASHSLHDDSSGPLQGKRVVNRSRTRRKAEYTCAVTREICEDVVDLLMSEPNLLIPSHYGIGTSTQREHLLLTVEKFVLSLPSRYALGVESASEVLLHMRLLAVVRSNPSQVAAHIMDLKTEKNRTETSMEVAKRCLVTIACVDRFGLLEFITKLLASSGARVLDANVMLSADSFALDRFIVEMEDKIRLDSLSKQIEHFVKDSNGEQGSTIHKEKSRSGHEGNGELIKENRRVYGDPKAQEVENFRQIDTGVSILLSDKFAVHDEAIGEKPKAKGFGFLPFTKNFSFSTPFSLRPPNSTIKAENILERSSIIPSNNSLEPSRFSSKLEDEQKVGYFKTKTAEACNNDLKRDAQHTKLLDARPTSQIPFDELMLIETLGTGRVSTIYRAVWKHIDQTNQLIADMVALKVAMVNPQTFDTKHVDELRREAAIAARLHHPNICELIGVSSDPECFCLAYEFCEVGSLLSLLNDPSRCYECFPIALDIANGMDYLHSRNIIHRDLKPSNILLTRDRRAKIADFGMSVANSGQELTAETGTYRYMAPEVVRHESYSSSADVYSFGVCLWQLITRKTPFESMTPIQAAYAVAHGSRPEIPKSTPNHLRDIISSCWDQNSQKRPSFRSVATTLAGYSRASHFPCIIEGNVPQFRNMTPAEKHTGTSANLDGAFPLPREGIISLDFIHEGDVGLEI